MTLGAARVMFSLNDLSAYVDQIMRGYIVAIVRCERGPLWEPTPVASWDEFERLFGRCYPGSSDPLVLKTGLLQGAKFLVVRIAHSTDQSDPDSCTALKSSITLQDRGNIPIPGSITSVPETFSITAPAAGSLDGIEVGPFNFTIETNDAITLTVGAGADQTFQLTGLAQSAQDVADQINAATTGVTATVNEDETIHLAANVATNGLQLKTVANDCYSVLGLTTGTYPAIAGTNFLVVIVDGGADQEFTLTPGVSRTAGQVAAELAGLTGAAATASNGRLVITSDTTGLTSTIQIKATSTATAFGFNNLEHAGAVGEPQDTLTLEADNPGAWGDSLKIAIYDSDLHPSTTFDIRISYTLQGGLNEYFSDLDMDPASDRYAVEYINLRSRLVKAYDENSTNPAPSDRPVVNESGSYMTGGSNGGAITDADYLGDEDAQTGIFACDKTYMSMDIIMPGTTSITALQALAGYCELRGEWIGYVNTPAGYDPMDAKKWRMGEDPYSHEAFNSHRLVIQFGRPLVYNAQYDRREYISSLGMLAACISKTDTYYQYSYAPVGPRRGTVDYVEGIDFNLADYRGYQDMFAEYGIDSLIISHEQGIEGAMFWEQYTSQRAASALRDLNVVRFCTMIRKSLMPVLKMFLFEPNHPVTWREVHRTLEPSFQLWQAQYGIYGYALQCDRDAFFDGGLLKNAVLNSGLEIDQGIYRARALIQPTRAIRYLEFELGVMRTGEAFANYTQLKELPGWVRS